MIGFVTDIETRLNQILQAEVGTGSTDLTNKVITFDDHLTGWDVSQLPAVVIFIREGESAGEEINAPQGLTDYLIHLYYLDTIEVDPEDAAWTQGKTKRANIMSRIEKTLKNNRTLGGLDSVDTDGTREAVWNVKVDSFNFDASGQEEYYTFTGEMYLTIQTSS